MEPRFVRSRRAATFALPIGVLSSIRSAASSTARISAGLLLRDSNGERLVWPLLLLGAALPPGDQ